MKRRSFLGLLAFVLPVAKAAAAPTQPTLKTLSDAGNASASLLDTETVLNNSELEAYGYRTRARSLYESLSFYPPECYFEDAATRIHREILVDADGSRYPKITFDRQQDFDDWEAHRMDEFGFPLKDGRR